jgi:hypothetical protein
MFILKQTRSYVVFEANCCHPKCIYEVHDAYYWDGEALTIRFFLLAEAESVATPYWLCLKMRNTDCWAAGH